MSHRPFAYPAQCLWPDGSLEPDAQLLRRVLVEDLGLKPRDIVSLFSKDGRNFRLGVRSGGVLISIGQAGPPVIVSERSAWIVPRGGGTAHVTGKPPLLA